MDGLVLFFSALHLLMFWIVEKNKSSENISIELDFLAKQDMRCTAELI